MASVHQESEPNSRKNVGSPTSGFLHNKKRSQPFAGIKEPHGRTYQFRRPTRNSAAPAYGMFAFSASRRNRPVTALLSKADISAHAAAGAIYRASEPSNPSVNPEAWKSVHSYSSRKNLPRQKKGASTCVDFGSDQGVTISRDSHPPRVLPTRALRNLSCNNEGEHLSENTEAGPIS